jgi:subtilisin family serine protease
MKRTSSALGLIGLSALLFACSGDQQSSTVPASASTERSTALGVQQLQLPAPEAAVDSRLRRASGPVDVWVALDQNSLARARAMLAESTGVARKRAQASTSGEGKAAASAEPASIAAAMTAQRAAIRAQQTAMAASLSGLGAKELARVSVAHNAIAITVDAERIAEIAKMPGVRSVRPVIHYELHLGATVPYIGAAAVQTAGFDGTGVKVAVLDSGIDYTHKNLGGAGTLAAYQAAWGTSTSDPKNTTRDGLFPTAKVIDGFDFVGEAWPNDARTEDPDPIDFEGHGTHVADIIAGKSADGTHRGVAPGASLYAVKTCSAISSSCNGIALLKGMDFALDPNGDSDLSDAADVINMSLGSSYGQIEDDLTQAASNAVALGTIVVASAGNSADRPYIVGSPSIAPGAISVAQTQVPSAASFPVVVNSPPAIAGIYLNTATVDWAPIGAGATGDVKTALQAGGTNNLACTALPAGSLAGKIALIDRGSCAISIKVDNAAKAGAIGALIALIAPGDAVTFSFGGGSTFVPTLVIQQSLGNAIKGQLNAASVVNISMSPASAVPLVGSMVGSSSRGPSFSLQTIKPEIGAPGASVSAIAGSGNGTGAFGGTSGAAPMVAGAAALLVQANPSRSPVEIKAMLMNSAETTVYTNPATQPGVLAPISRIGAGEVRVNRALALKAAAWDQSTLSAGLSFGQIEAERQITISRTLRVQNFENAAKTFQIASSFRYADDAASNAVVVQAPGSVNVPANGSADVTVTLLINPTRLPNWTLNGGLSGGNGALLNGPEYDGYLTLTSGGQTLSVPWHVLPRRAAKLAAGLRGSSVTLLNSGAAVGEYDFFSRIGTSGVLTGPPPGPGSNEARVDLKSVGVRFLEPTTCGVAGGCLQFAVATHGRIAHPLYPRGIEIEIDVNGDSSADYVVFQQEFTGFGVTGQSVVAVRPITSSSGTIFFFNDADLNSGTMIYTIPLSAIGSSATQTLNFGVFAYDNYFTGYLTDSIVGMRFTPASPRFSAPGGPFGSVAIGASAPLPYVSAAVPNTQSSETGLLLMFRRNAGAESQEIALPVLPVP